MYNFKEKNKHFNDLRNVAAAEVDLELLRATAPEHPRLKTFMRKPSRYSEDILFALLDIISREEILLNRREKDNSESPEPQKDVEDPKRPLNSFEIDAQITEQQVQFERIEKEEAIKRAEAAEESLSEKEDEKNDLESELEEEQQARAEAEERAETAEQALEEEQKKEQPAQECKSTKSTPESTGKTSKTKKSK